MTIYKDSVLLVYDAMSMGDRILTFQGNHPWSWYYDSRNVGVRLNNDTASNARKPLRKSQDSHDPELSYSRKQAYEELWVRKCESANVGPQMWVRKCESANQASPDPQVEKIRTQNNYSQFHNCGIWFHVCVVNFICTHDWLSHARHSHLLTALETSFLPSRLRLRHFLAMSQ